MRLVTAQSTTHSDILITWVILLLVGRTRIIEDKHPDQVAIAPKMLVVVLNRFAHVPQSVRWDDEEQIFLLHRDLCTPS